MIPSRKPCDCSTGELYRVERDPWMRLVFPSRGLYHCAGCGQNMLLAVWDVVQARQRRQGTRPLPPEVAPA
jgi:hypothetical protein